MPYTINEGSLAIEPVSDRSINILSVAHPEGGAPVNIVITRDACEPGEDIEASVSRQTQALARQTQDFKSLSRKPLTLGAAQQPAIVLESRFKQAGQTIYQSQAVIERAAGQLIVFTLNSAAPIDPPLREAWMGILESFTPR